MTLSDLTDILEMLAPPEGAAEWDNTGLILEAKPGPPVQKVLLTLDLTAEVAAEALDSGVQAIVAYHPPVFTGLKQLNRADPVAAPLLDLLAAGVSVYSPHTALDAAPEGMSDWMAGAFEYTRIEAIEGSGRLLSLETPLTPAEVGRCLRSTLALPYLRRALAAGGVGSIRRLALCPGAGASVLTGLEVDAVVTGEMKHHDILSFTRRGVHVFLSEHTHTERPYLAVLRERLQARLPAGVAVLLSLTDKDPVELVDGNA
jgi:dinuclear metal center YbgI/SA1388 family protein